MTSALARRVGPDRHVFGCLTLRANSMTQWRALTIALRIAGCYQ